MKIAQIAPLWESVPPKLYGGTERIVSYTEEMVRQGHDVTLLQAGILKRWPASGPPALRRFDRNLRWSIVMCHWYSCRSRSSASRQADSISFIPISTFGLPPESPLRDPVLTTLHGRLDLPELVPMYRVCRHAGCVDFKRAAPTLAERQLAGHGITGCRTSTPFILILDPISPISEESVRRNGRITR